MKKIIPYLWFDTQAKEAAEFYVSAFSDCFGSDSGETRIINIGRIEDTPSGSVEILNFRLLGQEFSAISAGPYFKFTQAVSFIVGCEKEEEINKLWEKLMQDGTALMPLDKYPFSERYGWVQDKYGISWQLILTKPASHAGEHRPRIMPSLLFVGDMYGKAEEAINFYLSVFKNLKIGTEIHYDAGQEPNKEGTMMFADFMLEDVWFAAMDGGGEHNFAFNEAISFMVNCNDQAEIDYYWEKLSAVPEAEQCGWLKDKFGLSWQIVPIGMNEMLKTDDKERVARVTQAFLKMKKFDLAKLRDAYEGK